MEGATTEFAGLALCRNNDIPFCDCTTLITSRLAIVLLPFLLISPLPIPVLVGHAEFAYL